MNHNLTKLLQVAQELDQIAEGFNKDKPNDMQMQVMRAYAHALNEVADKEAKVFASTVFDNPYETKSAYPRESILSRTQALNDLADALGERNAAFEEVMKKAQQAPFEVESLRGKLFDFEFK